MSHGECPEGAKRRRKKKKSKGRILLRVPFLPSFSLIKIPRRKLEGALPLPPFRAATLTPPSLIFMKFSMRRQEKGWGSKSQAMAVIRSPQRGNRVGTLFLILLFLPCAVDSRLKRTSKQKNPQLMKTGGVAVGLEWAAGG